MALKEWTLTFSFPMTSDDFYLSYIYLPVGAGGAVEWRGLMTGGVQ